MSLEAVPGAASLRFGSGGPWMESGRSAPIATLEEAGAWLEGLIDLERTPRLRRSRLSLAPIRALLARLGNPERGLRVLHVAGSKGKGSTALLAEALLRAVGRRVATFTSPHLERWTERFRLDGAEVAGERLAAAVETLRPHVEALRAGDPETVPTFFDATTAAALLLFAEAEVDAAVLEVGLGGRLDSTNACAPAACCITSIELEHTEVLGDTLGRIAGEKAGILKPGVPAVVGALHEEAAAAVRARAAQVGAPLSWLGRDFTVEVEERGADGLALGLRDGSFAAEAALPLLGAHHAANAALAVAWVRRAAVVPDAELARALPRAFAGARLPGRVELLGRRPWIVVDSAHTAASARALGAALAKLPHRRARLVLSVSAGKDLDAICRSLAPHFDAVTITRAERVRSLEPEAVARAVRTAAPGAAARVVPNPHLALRAAREGLEPDGLLCATGSVYLAGIARGVLAGGDASARVVVSRRDGEAPRDDRVG